MDTPTVTPKETFTKLMRAQPPRGTEWCVLTYLLSSSYTLADGTPNPFRGAVLPLGSFSTEVAANKHAQELQARSGYPSIFVAKYAYPVALQPGAHPGVAIVKTKDEKAEKLAREEYERDKLEYERRQAYMRELDEEAKEETNPDSLEYLKRKVYLTVKHRVSVEAMRREIASIEEALARAEQELRHHLKVHPEHDAQLIPFLFDKLIPRDEEGLAKAIGRGYLKLREEAIAGCEPLPEEQRSRLD